MKERPISEQDLKAALECRLVEPDGTSWQVVDVTVERGRAWVRARRPPGEHEPAGHGSEGTGDARQESRPRLRVFDTVLSRSARLIWEFPGGHRVEAVGADDGDLQWSVKGPGDETRSDNGGGSNGSFFQDAFLAT